MESKTNKNSHIIIICGQTATGKSSLAVHLAQKYNGEIISCDSRQVYKGLDIGSNKITKTEMENIPHFGVDICESEYHFTVCEFQKYAREKIKDIIFRGKTPILCGGTGLYIDSTMFLHYTFGGKQKSPLFENWEYFNEIKDHTITWIGLYSERENLFENIKTRISKHRNLVFAEIKTLLDKRISKAWLSSLGLEYTLGVKLLDGEITEYEYENILSYKTLHYAKRQLTWFKRNKYINWIKVR